MADFRRFCLHSINILVLSYIQMFLPKRWILFVRKISHYEFIFFIEYLNL